MSGLAGSPYHLANARLQKLRAFLNWMPVASLILGPDGSAQHANRGWEVLSGCPAGAWRGDGWLDAIAEPERSAVLKRFRIAAARGTPGCDDFRLASAAGTRWTRWWWQSGPASGLITCVADLDDLARQDQVQVTGASSALAVPEAEVSLQPRFNPVLGDPSDTTSGRDTQSARPPRTVGGIPLVPDPPRVVMAQSAVAAASMLSSTNGAFDASPAAGSRPAEDAGLDMQIAQMVVHRLFGAGLLIQSAATICEGPAAERIEHAVAELDAIIQDVRTMIFAPRASGPI